MELIGVELVGKITTNLSNQKVYEFSTPYGFNLVSNSRWKSKLKHAGSSFQKLILDINKLTSDDIPKCSICKVNPCRIKGSFIHPKLESYCNNSSCGSSYAKVKQASTQKELGFIRQGFGTHSAEVKSEMHKRSARTSLERGVHPTQTGATFKGLGKKNIIWNFEDEFDFRYDSKIERSYHQINFDYLSKFYYLNQGNFKLPYKNLFTGKSHLYYPDFYAIPEHVDYLYESNNGLIIEVKKGNLFINPISRKSSWEENYSKFYECINKHIPVLLVDNHIPVIIKNHNELNLLFKEYL